jgi:hypothetical protein
VPSFMCHRQAWGVCVCEVRGGGGRVVLFDGIYVLLFIGGKTK